MVKKDGKLFLKPVEKDDQDEEEKVTLSLMKNYIRLGYAIGYLPYKFKTVRRTMVERGREVTTVTRRFTCPRSIIRLLITIFSYTLLAIYNIFLVVRSVQAYRDKEQPAKEKFKIYYLTGNFISLNYGTWIHLRYYGKLHGFYNAVMDTVGSLKKDLVASNSKWNMIEGVPQKKGFFKWIFRTCTLLTFLNATLRGLSVLGKPSSKILISSLVVSKSSKNVSPLLKIAAAAFHFHVTALGAFMSLFQIATLLWFVRNLEELLKKLRGEWSKTVSEPQLYHIYYCLTLLQKDANQMYGIVPLAADVSCIFFCMMNIFIAVVHKDLGALFRALTILYIFVSFFKAVVKTHEESRDLIDSWKCRQQRGQGNQGWFQKFQRSCQPLRVSLAGFFYIDKGFILTFVMIIVDQTTTLILSYRDS